MTPKKPAAITTPNTRALVKFSGVSNKSPNTRSKPRSNSPEPSRDTEEKHEEIEEIEAIDIDDDEEERTRAKIAKSNKESILAKIKAKRNAPVNKAATPESEDSSVADEDEANGPDSSAAADAPGNNTHRSAHVENLQSEPETIEKENPKSSSSAKRKSQESFGEAVGGDSKRK